MNAERKRIEELRAETAAESIRRQSVEEENKRLRRALERLAALDARSFERVDLVISEVRFTAALALGGT